MKEYTFDESRAIVEEIVSDAIKKTGLGTQEVYMEMASEIIIILFCDYLKIRKLPTDLFSDFLKEKGL